jgi:hypothetical protein
MHIENHLSTHRVLVTGGLYRQVFCNLSSGINYTGNLLYKTLKQNNHTEILRRNLESDYIAIIP